MERERQPDRDGYLKFKRDLDASNEIPDEAFADWLTPGERGAPGQYLDLYWDEKKVEGIHAEPVDQVLKDLQKDLPDLRDEEIPRKARGGVNNVLRAWQDDRARSHEDYVLQQHVEVDREVSRRQKEHPSETPGQSWFKVKVKMQRECAARLSEQRWDVEHALRKAIREKQTRLPGDPGYAVWREQMRQKNRGGRGR
jgi:hypothetical protein